MAGSRQFLQAGQVVPKPFGWTHAGLITLMSPALPGLKKRAMECPATRTILARRNRGWHGETIGNDSGWSLLAIETLSQLEIRTQWC